MIKWLKRVFIGTSCHHDYQEHPLMDARYLICTKCGSGQSLSG